MYEAVRRCVVVDEDDDDVSRGHSPTPLFSILSPFSKLVLQVGWGWEAEAW